MTADEKTSKKSPTPAKADERNVATEPVSLAGLPLEDQLQLWWDENKLRLLGYGLALILIVAAFQGFRLFRQSAEAKIQAQYQALETREDQLAFAESHSNHPLGGLTWLALADDAFQAEDFSDANASYRKAVDTLRPSPFADRARLGVALTALQLGDRSESASLLEAIARDEKATSAARAEAAFHRAALALEDGDSSTYGQFSEIISTLPFAEGWNSRLDALAPAEAEAEAE